MKPEIRFSYEPHQKQKEVHLACSPNSPNFYTIVCAGRQSGKSKLSKYQAIQWALSEKDLTVWYVLPSEGQAKKVFREFYPELYQKGLVKTKIQSKGDIYIELINGSKIEFKTSGTDNNLRGSSVHYLVLDEAAFISKQTIEYAILPTMAAQGRKILIVSTPKGKNYFYELWMNAFNKDESISKDFKSFQFTSKDNTKAPAKMLELVESFRRTLPDAIFRQEFLAEWCDSEAVFNNINELARILPINKPNSKDRYYMGIDIALSSTGDFTVISIINSKGEMVFMDRFRGVEAPELCKRIEDAYNLFMPVKTIIEQNNQGLPIIQYLQGKIRNMEGFYTTNESKSLIINQLIAAFSSKEIFVLNDEILKKELEAFVFKFSQTGKIRFEAASGFNDDCVMSLAFAWHNYVSNRITGGYKVYCGDTFKPLKDDKGYDDGDDEQSKEIIFKW